MPARAFILATLLVVCSGQQIATAAPPVPVSTFNEFIPEDRPLTDCVSAVPKPGCGSEARGGWRQGLVAGLLVVGLAFIGWRIVVNARRARR